MSMKSNIINLSALILLMASPLLRAAEWVPPGFESLNEPQVTVVDINYGGYIIASTLVEFTQEEVRFLEPTELVSAIPELLDPAAFSQLLDHPFPTNAAHLCSSGYQLDCGVVTPDPVSIIFDRDQLLLRLFLAPELLVLRTPQNMKFLPDSDAPVSMYSNSAMYFSGNTGSAYSFNLYNNSQIAWKENHLVSRVSVTEDALLLDQFSLGRNYHGQQFDLGLFRANAESFSFMGTEQFLGVGMQSSLLSLQPSEQYQGTRIELFLSTRSRVELHSNGRLLSTRLYEAGNQLIDTTDLPGGAYELEIRITDAAGSTRVEYQFFSRTSRLPPSDSAQYFLQVGQLQSNGSTFDELRGSPIMLRGGFNRRIGEVTGWRSSMAVTGNQWLIETGLSRMGTDWELHSSLATDDSGAYGKELAFYWYPTQLQLGVNLRTINDGSQQSLLRQNQKQLQVSLELPTRLGNFSVFSRKISNGFNLPLASNGFRWRSNGWRDGAGIGSTSLEISQNSGEMLMMLNFSWRLGRNDGSWTVSPQLYQDSDGADMRGVVESSWQSRDESRSLLALRAAREGRDSLEARVASEGRHIGSDVTARYDVESSGTTIFGKLSNSFALHRDGAVMSGSQSAESAFLVSVDGSTPDTVFDVLVDGSPRGTVHSNDHSLVHLSPFKTYSVELVPKGDKIVNLDQASQEHVLYPGNVVGLHWTASSVVVGFGRVVNANGEGIADALIENASGLVITDDDGYFQGELDTKVTRLKVRKKGNYCVLELPQLDPEKIVAALGTMQCQTVQQ